MPTPTYPFDNAEQSARWLFSYDIAEDRLRSAVSRCLSAHGEREQFSVFVCWLTPAEHRRLARELRVLLVKKGAALTLRGYRLGVPIGRHSASQPTGLAPASFWLT